VFLFDEIKIFDGIFIAFIKLKIFEAHPTKNWVSEQTNRANVEVFLSDLLKESLNKLLVFMVPDLYLEALRLLMNDDENSRKTTDSI
jgi:hypothetical protein